MTHNTVFAEISALSLQRLSEQEFIDLNDYHLIHDDDHELYLDDRHRRLNEVIQSLSQNTTPKSADALDAVTRFLNFSDKFDFCFYFFADVINIIGGVEAFCDLAVNLADRLTPDGIQGIDIPDMQAFYTKHKKNIFNMISFINDLWDVKTEKNSMANDKSIILLIKFNDLVPESAELKIDDIAQVIYGNKNGQAIASYETIIKSAVLFVIYNTLVNLQDFIEDKTLV